MENIQKYFLESQEINWKKYISGYRCFRGMTIQVWFGNLFGDILFRNSDHEVCYFDSSAGDFRKLGNSKDHFLDWLESSKDHQDDIFMIPLVDECLKKGMNLQKGECYSFLTLPILGGDFSVENIFVDKMENHYAIASQICNNIEGLPDGTHVEIQWIPNDSKPQ
jgi:hypothetical protein